MNFFDKLSRAISQNQSLLYVGLDPSLEVWPECYDNEKGVMDRLKQNRYQRPSLNYHELSLY